MSKAKEPNELARARAQRVRRLREALRYSREKFCQKYAKHGFTYSALQSWEAIRWNGLTEGGAHKLAACFKEEGLNVTAEWLLFGNGPDPFEQAFKRGLINIFDKEPYERVEEPLLPYLSPSTGQQVTLLTHNALSIKEIITQELQLFHQLNPGCVDAIITDDSLAPWLQPGDHVAGKRYFASEMARGLDQPCIVQTGAGNNLIRVLKAGSTADVYTLLCTNADTIQPETLLPDIALFSVAPILWLRKLPPEN